MPINTYIRSYTLDEKEYFLVRVVGQANRKSKRVEIQRKGFSTHSEAKRAAKMLVDECFEKSLRLTNVSPTVEALLVEFGTFLNTDSVFHKRVHATTAYDMIRAIELYGEHFLKRPASEVTHSDIEDAIELMVRDDKSYSRIKAFRGAMNSFFRWAISKRKVPSTFVNPMSGIVINRPKDEKRPLILKPDQVRFLLERAYEIQHPWADVWHGSYLSGLRSGESQALLKDDVDLDAKIIRVHKSFNKRLNQVKGTKSGRFREVAMNERMVGLARRLLATVPGAHFYPRLPEWQRGEQARVLRTFCIGIGLPPISFHALRACWATHLIGDGVEPARVMKMAGWSELKTAQFYIRLAGVETRGATDALDKYAPRPNTGGVISIFERSQG